MLKKGDLVVIPPDITDDPLASRPMGISLTDPFLVKAGDVSAHFIKVFWFDIQETTISGAHHLKKAEKK